jgi:hypothetical protein
MEVYAEWTPSKARSARSSWLSLAAWVREERSSLPMSEGIIFMVYCALREELTPKASPKSIFW